MPDIKCPKCNGKELIQIIKGITQKVWWREDDSIKKEETKYPKNLENEFYCFHCDKGCNDKLEK